MKCLVLAAGAGERWRHELLATWAFGEPKHRTVLETNEYTWVGSHLGQRHREQRLILKSLAKPVCHFTPASEAADETDEAATGYEHAGREISKPAVTPLSLIAPWRIGQHKCDAVGGDVAKYFTAIAKSKLRLDLGG